MAEQLRPLTMVLSRNVYPLGVENTGDWLALRNEKNARNRTPINPYCDGTVPDCVSDRCRKYGRLASFVERKKRTKPKTNQPVLR